MMPIVPCHRETCSMLHAPCSMLHFSPPSLITMQSNRIRLGFSFTSFPRWSSSVRRLFITWKLNSTCRAFDMPRAGDGASEVLPFRSVLPHEPPLLLDAAAADGEQQRGYLHIQGAFTPKINQKKQQHEDGGEKEHTSISSEDHGDVWFRENRSAFEKILLSRFVAIASQNMRPPPTQLEILDSHPPYTKVRLEFTSSTAAHEAMLLYRTLKLNPVQLYENQNNASVAEDDISFDSMKLPSFLNLSGAGGAGDAGGSKSATALSHRALQITQITRQPLPQPSWTRSNPPKFRRLLARPGEDTAALDRERQTTRFVVITNLLDTEGVNALSAAAEWEEHPHATAHAIRSIVAPFDTSRAAGVEVFVPSQSNKRSRYCHVGMRSAEDARAVVLGLQGKVVQWPWVLAAASQHNGNIAANGNDTDNNATRSMQSGKLFVDYVAVTQRSEARAAIRDAGGYQLEEKGKGEPTRPQCTSTTEHVQIPGLVLVPDFVSEKEEAVLMAVLTGPQAPWAPLQKTASFETAAVRRKVQHYGYVFDYQTADVLRDRTQEGADCPPMPRLSNEMKETLSGCDDEDSKEKYVDLLVDYSRACVDDGRGWEALAALVERTRRYEFRDEEGTDESNLRNFPDLNQLTVNHYLPGEGIGSHVDTPSAFDDGLISISLNSGTVMEFRKQNDKGRKKLVYLPPRSLLLMSRDARYEWEHAIVTRMTDTHNGEMLARKLRLSLTFRTARSADGVSHLPLAESPELPPVWGDRSKSSQPSLATPECERDHVHAVYDAIATQWHHTRGMRGVLWPGATQFLQKLPQGSIVADVGCGDGKYFPAIWEAGSYVIGTDISEPLLRTALHDGKKDEEEIPENRRVSSHRHHLRNRPAVAVADCMSVPFRTSSCDAAICIAVLHHISTRKRRLRCIEELVRIVKPGGLVNVQAWAMDQEEGSRRKFAANDVFVPFNAQPKFLQVNQTKDGASTNENESSNAFTAEKVGKSTAQVYSEAFCNAEYDDRKGLVVFKRYCHLYRKGELDELANEVYGVHIVESGFESGNYYIIFQVRKNEDTE